MKNLTNYLIFLTYFIKFKLSVGNQIRKKKQAFFNVTDIDLKKDTHKMKFNHLVKLLIDQKACRDLKTINNQDFIVTDSIKLKFISYKDFVENDAFLKKPSKYDFITNENKQKDNVIFVDFGNRRKIS